jgi:ribonuclease J
MVSITFYGGIGEVGGNKILVEDEDARLWLDFGRSFSAERRFYAGWLQPRVHSLLSDLLEFSLIPRLKGLYSQLHLEGVAIPYEEPSYDAVLISHAHADHVDHIRFLDPSIPIYCGSGTKLFLEASETVGYVDYGEHPYQSFRTGDRIRKRDIEMEPIHVDHSIPASYGFVIHASSGSLVYTGDLRRHGPKAEMTEDFLEAAADAEPEALIIEGTKIAEESKGLSEGEVLEGVLRVLKKADREGEAVFYTQNRRDTDRFRTFYTAAEVFGRKLVVTTWTAHLLSKLVEDERLDLPDPLRDDGIAVYFRRKRSGEYREEDYYRWERPYLERMVTAEEIRHRPANYLVCLELHHFPELIDIRPRGGHYIYSMSEHQEEEALEEELMHNWLRHFSLKLHQLHASGHMGRRELLEAVELINPTKVYPIHTEHPDLFRHLLKGRRVEIPQTGEKYAVDL